MKALDFEYDGILLSDLGYTICTFGSKGLETISNGSQITFNNVSMFNGSQYGLVSSVYEETLTATFSICKSACITRSGDLEELTVDDISELMRWLNRKTYHKFKLMQDGYENLYFEGSFNIQRYELDGKVYGLELVLVTNRPFALHDETTYKFKMTEDDLVYKINDISDEIGFIYADVKVVCRSSGDLKIHNSMEDRTTIIKNCSEGEIITFTYPVVTTSNLGHELQNDFNFNFVRIANKWGDVMNTLTFSIPCDVELSYIPIKKVGV